MKTYEEFCKEVRCAARSLDRGPVAVRLHRQMRLSFLLEPEDYRHNLRLLYNIMVEEQENNPSAMVFINDDDFVSITL